MKFFQSFIRKYFGFSESETNGFIILIPMIIIVLVAPRILKMVFLNYSDGSNPKEDARLREWLDEIDANLSIVEEVPIKFKTFNFDPNTVTKEEMVSLGLTKKTAKRIDNYRNAGGQFNSKKDVLKIYGISKERVNALSDFMVIPNSKKETKKRTFEKRKPHFKKFKKRYYKFELNQVSADSLIKIFGVGPTLSKRIIKYRDKLGGFNSINQLNEVYGLDSTVIKEIGHNTILDAQLIKPLNLNSDSLKYLGNHPYVSYKLAKIILTYKSQHGPFKNTEAIKSIKIVTDSMYLKLKPYLRFDN